MSVMNQLKAEISRLSRKEINKELAPVKRVNATQRGLIANLRRDLISLQKEVARLKKVAPASEAVETAAGQEDGRQGFWMTGKGVVSLRKRLGITQVELAKLADVSHQTIVRWEKAEGKIPFRGKETAGRMQHVRSMDKRAASEVLGKPLRKKREKK